MIMYSWIGWKFLLGTVSTFLNFDSSLALYTRRAAERGSDVSHGISLKKKARSKLVCERKQNLHQYCIFLWPLVWGEVRGYKAWCIQEGSTKGHFYPYLRPFDKLNRDCSTFHNNLKENKNGYLLFLFAWFLFLLTYIFPCLHSSCTFLASILRPFSTYFFISEKHITLIELPTKTNDMTLEYLVVCLFVCFMFWAGVLPRVCIHPRRMGNPNTQVNTYYHYFFKIVF